jgi:hypothetical protein
MPRLTLAQVVAVLGPAAQSRPSRKPRDPLERNLLQQAGDPSVAREDPRLVREAGTRPTRSNSFVKP